MSKTLKEQPDAIAVAEIVRHGEQLTLPEGMTLKQAKKLIERRMAYEEEPTAFDEAYDYFPFDGANALNDVLVEKFGWEPATSTPSFWGDEQTRLISVEIRSEEQTSELQSLMRNSDDGIRLQKKKN